jgi:hypothetical protein
MKLTLEQINDMKHCIGFGRGRVKRGKYEAYRNYYNTGEFTDESWDELVIQGYAKQYSRFDQFIIYCVTEKGIRLLEEILDVKIVNGD